MWRLAAPSLAFVLLGASFLRAGSMPMVAACAVLLAMLAVPRWWAVRIAQLALLLAALRWVWLTWTLAAMRAAAGVPATRMGVILGSVAMLTLLSALVFRARPLQRYYGLYRERGGRADE